MIQKSLSQFRHRIRNRLNVACLLLEVVQRKIDCGQWQQVEPLIDKALQAFRDIDEDLIVDRQPVDRADSLPSSTRILIVDDNVNEGHLLAELLTSFDFEVTVVGDGRKALHYLRQQGKPDLVLLDMNMPNLDGADTIRLIRQQSERVNQLRDRFFRVGASAILFISLSFLARYFGLNQLSFGLIVGAPIAMTGYLLGMGYIRWAFPTYINGPVLQEAIEKELDRRQKDASIL